MKIFINKILLLFTFAVLCTACKESHEPSSPIDPQLALRDSLIAIYGSLIDVQDLDYLGLYEYGATKHTYLYGGTNGEFWLGIFESPDKKITEYTIDLDPDSLIPEAIYNPILHSHMVWDFEFFEIYGFSNTSLNEDAISSKSLLRISHDNWELKSKTEYTPRNAFPFLDYVRAWKGGFLLEYNGEINDYGVSYTQFISSDFSESIRWECRAPYSPPLGVLYFEVDFFLAVWENSVEGFDYSICQSWTKNILDFYGVTTCPGCSTSIRLLNQIEDTITVEVKLNEEVRKAILVYRTGEVVSNEVIEN